MVADLAQGTTGNLGSYRDCKMATLPRFWKEWISRYTADAAYWYVPKGKSIGDVPTIKKQLKLLGEFEEVSG
jgi:hypothetical protein